MAEDTKQEAAETGKKFPMKTLLIMVGIVVIEGAAISAAFLVAGGPSDVNADGLAIDAAVEAEKPVEVLVVSDKFQNTRSGKIYLYDTEIYIVIRQKHKEKLDGDLESMSAAISTDIATIYRRAEPAHLTEPTLATLTRQIKSTLDNRFKKDEKGDSIVQEVLIRKCTQLPLY